MRFGALSRFFETLSHIAACLCFIGENKGFCPAFRAYPPIVHGDNPIPEQVLSGANRVRAPNVSCGVARFKLDSKVNHGF
jgi:hypothetical protein